MFTNYNVEALGWGMTSFGGPLSSALKKAKLRVITDKECRKYFPIHSSQMCTYASGNDTCQVYMYILNFHKNALFLIYVLVHFVIYFLYVY